MAAFDVMAQQVSDGNGVTLNFGWDGDDYSVCRMIMNNNGIITEFVFRRSGMLASQISSPSAADQQAVWGSIATAAVHNEGG